MGRLGRVVLAAVVAVMLAAVGALSGFAMSLLRRRPPTSYTRSLTQPVPGPETEG